MAPPISTRSCGASQFKEVSTVGEWKDVLNLLFGKSPTAVPCSYCKASVGEPCVTDFGKIRQAHPVRRK